MTIKEIEEQKNLVVACQERLAQAEKEKEAIKAKLQEIVANEKMIRDEIGDLECVNIAELDPEELFDELNVLDGNPEEEKNSEPKFMTNLYSCNLKQFLEINNNKDVPINELKQKYAKRRFEFLTDIITKSKTYVLYSHYYGDELINGKPLYEYLTIKEQGIDRSYPCFGKYVEFGFDKDFYKNFKVRLTLAQIKAKYCLNLETAVMNILKRHEQSESV